jgi:glycerol uptake facilitator-like aquaporin
MWECPILVVLFVAGKQLSRALVAEFLGTTLLVAIVIGSGIMASELSRADVGLQLFENAAATAAGLFVLILIFGPVSGAHFNPVVTLADAFFGGISWTRALAYIPAQVGGAVAGAIVANLMFSLPAVSISTNERTGGGLWLAEVVATAGLLLTIFALVRTQRASLAAPAVGCYIGAAYFFTASTSFANPAVTTGRIFSDTFAGIEPGSVLMFILMQVIGAGLGVAVARLLYPDVAEFAGDVVVPHEAEPAKVAGGTA